MRRRGLSLGGWIAGWLVTPALAWGTVTGVVAGMWAAFAGLPAVVVTLTALVAVTAAVVLTHYALVLRDRWRNPRSHPNPPGGHDEDASPAAPGLSPAERRKRLDDMLYPPADQRLELGEECAAFAMKMGVVNEELEWKRERSIARAAQQIRDADPDLDPFEVQKGAEAHFQRYAQSVYITEWRDVALKIFDQARELGASAAKNRRLVEKPHADEMYEIPHLFRAMARRLGYEPPSEHATANWPAPPSLASELDNLAREGIALVAEMNEPVTPEPVEGGWKLEAGNAPDDWWEKADGFSQRIRDLLWERHPVLLKDYAGGYNAHIREERKKQKEATPEPDARPFREKLLDLANYERSGPRRVVEASLDGLHAARHRIGSAPAPPQSEPQSNALELAQKCKTLGRSIEHWLEGNRQRREPAVQRLAAELQVIEPDLDILAARRRGRAQYDRDAEAEYASKFRSEAKRLFGDAYEMGGIDKEYELLAVKPSAAEFEQAPKLFIELADRIRPEAA